MIFNMMIILLAVWAALIAEQTLYLILEIILAPFYCCKLGSVELLGFVFTRGSDDKWHYEQHRQSFMILGQPVLDIKKLDGVPYDSIEKKGNQMMVLCGIINLILSSAVGIACIKLWSAEGIMSSFPRTFGGSMIFYALFKTGITFYSLYKSTKDSLSRYRTIAINKIRSGIPVELLDLKPLSQLPYKDPIPAEKMLYLPLYFTYLDASRQFDKLPAAVDDINLMLINANDNRYLIPSRYDLLYYYSCHDINPEKAKAIYNQIKPVIEKDKDANAYRILGYYALNILKDKEKAGSYVSLARGTVESFSMGSERDLEKELIDRLQAAVAGASI
ncbi:MAG: hypothetical protein IJ757_09570 [Clostridiales bacterium]|nr:hypothetical protein [Clostridiales bacterium]